MNCMCKYSKGNEIIQKNKSETQVRAERASTVNVAAVAQQVK